MLIQTYQDVKPEIAGLYAGYRSFTDPSGNPERHVMTIWNLSEYHISFDLVAKCGNNRQKLSGMLKAFQGAAVQAFRHDEVSDKPGVEGTVRAYSTERAGPVSKIAYKIKPVKFVKQADAHIKNRKEWFELILNWQKLPEIMKPGITVQRTELSDKNEYWPQQDVAKKATFPDYIDLHIEKLTPLFDKMAPEEILKFQLKTFDKYLEDAILFNISPIYVVHGIGKGRLREEIAKRLKDNQIVSKFSNEYHAKFGFGSTTVWL